MLAPILALVWLTSVISSFGEVLVGELPSGGGDRDAASHLDVDQPLGRA